MKTKGIIENNEILLENDSTLLFPADYYDLINPSHFNLGDYFDIYIVSNMVIKIEQNDRELPKKNANTFLLFISEDGKKFFDKFSDNRNKDITIPSNYNLDGYNLELPFLVHYEKEALKSVSQNGMIIKLYDPNEIKYKSELCWIENNNLVSRFGKITVPEGLSEKDKKGNFKYDIYKLIENKIEHTLLSIDLNYKGNIPNDNKKAWRQIKLLSTRIPNDTRLIAEKVTNNANFSLLYNKNAKIDKDTNGFRGSLKDYNNWKKFGLEDGDFTALANKEKQNAIHLLGENNVKCLPNISLNWRLAIGLGNESVYETSITLHHIYGFPYIPASAIKGITNHYVLDLIKEAKEKKESYQDIENQYNIVFGNTKQQGKITFFDAMPLTAPKLKPDIMNVHYPDYYGGTSAPTDTQSPRPILFLTVEETEFQFMLGCKEDDKNLLETALKWLEKALQNKGIGAKTAVGYGYMNPVQQ